MDLFSNAAFPEQSEDEAPKEKSIYDIELPALAPSDSPHAWNEINEKQLRSALIGACKRMPRNAEAHFHLGLMYMRKCDGEEALRSFQHCSQLYAERLEQHATAETSPPPQLLSSVARLRSHTAQAAHLAAAASLAREERAPLLERLQKDLVSATNLDHSRPDVWNALALLHLTEGGSGGARDVLRSIRQSFPDYLDSLNNLGLAELALGNEKAAISCFQKVILCDKRHPEALSNYGLVLLRHAMYDAAIRAFESAVETTQTDGRGLSFAWGGLAVARAALGLMDTALEAAREAERMADPLNKARFAMLTTSIQARGVTEELRRGGKTAWDKRKHEKGMETDEKVGSDKENCIRDASQLDIRPSMDGAVLRLRALARDIKSSSASTALGAVLRLRHDFAWEESGNRNFGAEAAERLVEALEKDDCDSAAWVQLALLQMGTGEYSSARDFAVQAVSRSCEMESGWNSLAVAYQLNDETGEAKKGYEKAVRVILQNYHNRKNGLGGEESESEDENVQENESSREKEMDEVEDKEAVNEAGLAALAAVYNNMGNLRRQEGRSFSESLQCFEKSLKVGGESAVVYNNLALLYISAGRFEDADLMLDHALKLDEKFECALSNKLKLKAVLRRKQLEREREKWKDECEGEKFKMEDESMNDNEEESEGTE